MSGLGSLNFVTRP